MALASPTAGSALNSPSHSLLHRQLDIDTGASEGSVTVNATDDLLVNNGDLGVTGTRVKKGWLTDLEVTNAIAGSVTGNAATATAAASQVITDNAIATVDSASAATGEYAKFTANGLESKSTTEVRSDINVADGSTANTKATGAEVDTGTDDAKFVTAKAMADQTTFAKLVSPSFTTPALGTPSAGVLTNCTGLPEAGLADNAVTLAKMAHGTDGNLITYDAAGAPANVATGTADQVLTSNGAGAAPTFQDAGGGGANVDSGSAERAYGSTGTQEISHSLGVVPALINITANKIRDGAYICQCTGSARTTTTSTQNYTYVTWTVGSSTTTTANTGGSYILQNFNGATNIFAATISAISTTSFTINWSVNNNNSENIKFIWDVIA